MKHTLRTPTPPVSIAPKVVPFGFTESLKGSGQPDASRDEDSFPVALAKLNSGYRVEPLTPPHTKCEARIGEAVNYLINKRIGLTEINRLCMDKPHVKVIVRNGVQVHIHVNKFDEWQKNRDSANEFVNLTYFTHNKI